MSSPQGYRLTTFAVDDLREIASYLASEASEEIALRVEEELFVYFQKLADHPGIGHRRSDITALPVLFFPVYPYMVIYQRDTSTITIHAILHSARNVKRILRNREIN